MSGKDGKLCLTLKVIVKYLYFQTFFPSLLLKFCSAFPSFFPVYHLFFYIISILSSLCTSFVFFLQSFLSCTSYVSSLFAHFQFVVLRI